MTENLGVKASLSGALIRRRSGGDVVAISEGTRMRSAHNIVNTRSAGETDGRGRRFERYEGRRIVVALADGSRLEDCELVSAGHGRAHTLWVFTGGDDLVIPLVDVVDIAPAQWADDSSTAA